MATEKPDKPKAAQPIRITAPSLPKSLREDIKTTEASEQKITVRKTTQPSPKQADAQPSLPDAADINNPETDKAVDDIVAKESDTVLAVDDILAGKRNPIVRETTWKDKLRILLHNKWTWVAVGAVLLVLLCVPATRYKILGIVVKKQTLVTVTDSQTDTPVSNALVNFGGSKLKTDANGQVKLRARVGEQTVMVSKQYYKTNDTHYFIGFKNDKPLAIKLLATGRLVPVVVDNAINDQPVAGAVIHLLNTTAKTNIKGQATIALPTNAVHDMATLSLSGYNAKTVSIVVTSSQVASNSFTITPSGSIYFLSNPSGTINVMKANLDGSKPQSVLAGTGHETAATTRLLASRDWHYLVLEANRSGNGPSLYLINTMNNQVTEFDSTSATFNLIGWYNHDFVYSLMATSGSQWQSGSQILKEYDADQHELNQLDQDQALGSASSYAYQVFGDFFLAGSEVVYDTDWIASGGYDLSNQNDTIRTFALGPQTKKDYQSFPATSVLSFAAARYQPQAVYFAVTTSGGTNYYQYANGTVQTANINQTIFNQSSPTYVLSPSGNKTVWAELSNGQDLFLTGDSNAASPKQIAALNNYSPFGWYSDNYILAKRDNNQLYILPASGLSGGQQPLKITDYYEPLTNAKAYEYNGF